MKKVLNISFFAFVMFALFSGCSHEVSNIYNELNLPTLKITTDETTVSVEKGSYSWNTESQSVVVDAESSEEIAEKMEGTQLSPLSDLTLDFSKQPDKTSISLKGDIQTNMTPHIIESNKFTLPQEEGIYVYEIVGVWNEGEISFTIKVVVAE